MNERLLTQPDLSQADALQVAHEYDTELVRVMRQRDTLIEQNKRFQALVLRLIKDIDTMLDDLA